MTEGWTVPVMARCACLKCGTHAFRRLGADGRGEVEPTGRAATCSVCGVSGLVAVDDLLAAVGN